MVRQSITREQLADDLLHQQVAAIAYESPAAALSMLQALGFHDAKFYEDKKTGTNALLCFNEDRVIFAARGTEKNHSDILTDLKFRKTRLPSYEAHRGFVSAWVSIHAEVMSDLDDLQLENTPVTATGHSLGGAIAVLAAADLDMDRAVTFGAPRVGDEDFADFVQSKTGHRRYVRAADIVPLLPLLAMGFRHDCPAQYFTAAGQLIPDAGLVRELWGRFRALFTFDWLMVSQGLMPCPAPRRMFTDHRIGEYGRDLIIAEGAAQ